MRILLVEDDKQLGESLKTALVFEGYAVDWLERGDHVMPAVNVTPYDLIVLDVGLPIMNGFQVVSQLRTEKCLLPVLMLTALDAVPDRIKGLDSGADDYLTKPFDIDELSARIRSLMRRTHRPIVAVTSCADIEFNPVERSVKYGGDAIDLTAKELAILEILLRNKERFVTKIRLEEGIYGWGDEVSSNTVEVYISKLRKRFGSKRIQTMRGIGYRITE
ncbi:MAG: DNA-binding response OmpR family regulator [Pseudomonadales bacterium]|jgi:DNA-binding response OmpR family regulator